MSTSWGMYRPRFDSVEDYTRMNNKTLRSSSSASSLRSPSLTSLPSPLVSPSASPTRSPSTQLRRSPSATPLSPYRHAFTSGNVHDAAVMGSDASPTSSSPTFAPSSPQFGPRPASAALFINNPYQLPRSLSNQWKSSTSQLSSPVPEPRPMLNHSQSASALSSSPNSRLPRLHDRVSAYLKPPREHVNKEADIVVTVIPHVKSPLYARHLQIKQDRAKALAEGREYFIARNALFTKSHDEHKEPSAGGDAHDALEDTEPEHAVQFEHAQDAAAASSPAPAERPHALTTTVPPVSHDDDGKEQDLAAFTAISPSLNLRKVLKEQKAAAQAAADEEERAREAAKPFTGLTWGEIVKKQGEIASLYKPGKGERSHSPSKAPSTKNSLTKPKTFNPFGLSEIQRVEYKYAQEQGKWLDMRPAEQPTVPIPNDQMRVSIKTRLMNMSKADLGGQSIGYDTYIVSNNHYGYVRWVGRVPWGPGLWVGMELVEKHHWPGLGALVDFTTAGKSTVMMSVGEEKKQEKDKKFKPKTAAEQMAAKTESQAVTLQQNVNIARPLIIATMIPAVPCKDKPITAATPEALKWQTFAGSLFPPIDVIATLRDGLLTCFEMGYLAPDMCYFAPVDSVKRVAIKQKIDSKALLAHKEQQSNPFADVDELAQTCPKKNETSIEALSRFLTVSNREVLDGDRNKARCIFRWICHHIKFDPHTKFTDVMGVVRHRKANAEGLVMLFHALAAAGGLTCINIRGVEKRLNRTDTIVKNKHCWNAIKVDGEWAFIDCVFSSGQYVDENHEKFQQMFSDAYFCTPPALFILEHFPQDAFGENYARVLPSDCNNLQLLRSTISMAEWERAMAPGRAFVEYHMKASPFTYEVDCKQPAYQIEITAPSFIVFDVELKLKSHRVDLSQCSHIQYDGEQVTIYLIFPVPGDYICNITCKPSWRELDIYDKCLTYKLVSQSGLVPLSTTSDVIIGFLQHKKINSRDNRSLFNRHFTLQHPLSGHFLPKSPFIVQIKGPEIADSLIIACNGEWQRLVPPPNKAQGGMKMFEGTAIIQPKHDLLIYYEMDKKFHLLYFYKASLTSMTNVYLENDKRAIASAAAASAAGPGASNDLWHGKCTLSMEGRAFDASLQLDQAQCKFGRQVCSFILTISTAWDITISVQEGWKNGTPLADGAVVTEEMKNFRTTGPNGTTQYRVTATLPPTAALDPEPEEEKRPFNQNNFKNTLNIPLSTAFSSTASTPLSKSSANSDLDDDDDGDVSDLEYVPPAVREARAAAESRKKAGNRIPFANEVHDDKPKASTQYVLVVNTRNSKAGGPFRFALNYYFDVTKTPIQPFTSMQSSPQASPRSS